MLRCAEELVFIYSFNVYFLGENCFKILKYFFLFCSGGDQSCDLADDSTIDPESIDPKSIDPESNDPDSVEPAGTSDRIEVDVSDVVFEPVYLFYPTLRNEYGTV